MTLFRLVAVILFLFAALSGFGLGFHWQIDTDLGLIGAGLFFYALAGVAIPELPTRG